MKNVFQMCLVTVIQLVACYLSAWPLPEMLFSVFFVFIWQGLFLYLSSRIKEKNDFPRYEYNKIVWYAIIPIATLFPPLLTLLAIVVGSLYELRRVSGCESFKDWIKSQIVLNSSEDDDEVELEFKSVEFDRYNPATGLPMIGGVDISGNPNGSSGHN
ncbi:surface exclusion protein (plasmid) [Enterobacter cloacae]|uniref:surface exclusion protein n=1 Tax=Enterobacter chuandaensis TaxID=2497875 RepID=UPI00300C6413